MMSDPSTTPSTTPSTASSTSPTVAPPAEEEVLLRATDVRKHFPIRSASLLGQREWLRAVDGVSLEIRKGETLGLVGETGCGKSTLARCMTKLYDVSAGKLEFDGRDVTDLKRREMRPLRREMQMIFQDPYGSLNPRRRVGSIIGDAFSVHGIANGAERKRKVQELMELVGLNPEHYNRFPADFSGGQRQRIGVARAVALRPKLIVCDEPVSALDVSVQAQVLNLLKQLQDEFGLTYLFISHDLSVVRHISDRIAVMYLGRIVETAPAETLFEESAHPYTRALLSALPPADPDQAEQRERIVLPGDPPSPIAPPSGCRFHPRCPKARQDCVEVIPDPRPLRGAGFDAQVVECLHPLEPGEDLSSYRPTIDDSQIGVDTLATEGSAGSEGAEA
jgi:peptide/nickel transport system ATP-binding protein/oligopeptide transport system ATP-binding protein